MRKVPVLSLEEYINGNKKGKALFGCQLIAAFKEYGFAIIKNHSIRPELLKKAYELSKQLFDLPQDNKNNYHIPGGGGQRGYTAFGVEHAKGVSVKDLKEFWHVGRELSEKSPYKKSYPSNVWPSEIKDFKETFEEIYKELDLAGKIILEALAPMLGVNESYLSSRVDQGNSILRLLHYPPIPEGTDPRCIRAAAHGDINFITLLVSATASGLELLDKDGKWIPVDSDPNTIIVNVGDMLSRITNDVLPSTIHRVVNPVDCTSSRYSIPFFIHPRPEVVLSCLDNFKELGEKYADISSHDFLMERLKDIGLKK